MFPVLLAFVFLNCIPAGAQTGDAGGLAILLKGPVAGKGIPALPPNAMPYYFGQYAYEVSTIDVYYTAVPIVPPDTWKPLVCGRYVFLEVPGRAGKSLYYASDNDWAVFIIFPGDLSTACPFLDVFIRRLTYFTGISRDKDIVPYPAVLEVK